LDQLIVEARNRFVIDCRGEWNWVFLHLTGLRINAEDVVD
jgi:hypothetical protein